MSPKNHHSYLVYLSLLILTSFVLSACAGQVYSQELGDDEIKVEPLPIETIDNDVKEAESEVEPLRFVTHEEARDLVVAYLLEKFSLEAPGSWLLQDQTPQNLVGSSNFLYTSDAWVAHVSAPVVAPQHLAYSIEIDHVVSGLRWEGKVDAEGTITELTLSEPCKILSVEDARDAAANYLVEKYAWTDLKDWQECDQEPIENAGERLTFSAGSWVIQVEYFAAAPIVPEYRIVADHLNMIARWSGTIKANGEVTEVEYVKN